MTTTYLHGNDLGFDTLKAAEKLILANDDAVNWVHIGKFSDQDDTPTLHIDLWRGYDLCDLPELVGLEVVLEGHWECGRSYSLQLAK